MNAVVYDERSREVRRVIVPDSAAELKLPGFVLPGEKMILMDGSVVVTAAVVSQWTRYLMRSLDK
jgi:hypothetical protein